MQKHRYPVRLLCLLTAVLLGLPMGSTAEGENLSAMEADIAQQIAASDNPLVNPACTVPAEEPNAASQTDVVNILLLGIDDQQKDYTYRTEMAHTDAILLLSVNVGEDHGGNVASMVSIPRDTIAYVPNVKGIYKINSAINCGDARAAGVSRADDESVVGESEQGFETVCSTVSWLLGGVPIHYYCAVTMGAMQALGDLIGGVDFDLDMAYSGHSGRRYEKGPQHLDGEGILDYFRARKNATSDTGNDQVRTERQRDMMQAILDKLSTDQTLILKVLGNLQSNETIRGGFYTDVSTSAMMQFVGVGFNLLANHRLSGKASLNSLIGSYAVDGEYTNAFGNWKFRFPDPELRRQVIREVFGFDAAELRFVSREYAAWLQESGFEAVRSLTVADDLRDFITVNYQYESILSQPATGEKTADPQALTAEQTAALKTFTQAYGSVLQAFLAAADAVDGAALAGTACDTAPTTAMKEACAALQTNANALARLVGYPAGVGKKAEKIHWSSGVYMDEDPLINEIYVNFR